MNRNISKSKKIKNKLINRISVEKKKKKIKMRDNNSVRRKKNKTKIDPSKLVRIASFKKISSRNQNKYCTVNFLTEPLVNTI